MKKKIKGYQIENCFGRSGCKNSIVISHELIENVEALLKQENFLEFLKSNVTGPLKHHHEFRIAFADCPNACSQPQIKDIGIIGAAMPGLSGHECNLCRECVNICKENAVTIDHTKEKPIFEHSLCVNCGDCIAICPTGTIVIEKQGYRILLGGKLGRHPQLGFEQEGIFDEEEVLNMIKSCLGYYKKNSRNGSRFSKIFNQNDFDSDNK